MQRALLLLTMCLASLPAASQQTGSPGEQWDERFGRGMYLYGKEPVEFLREQVPKLRTGKALCLAAGEGRNAVFLEKATALAAERGVGIETRVADLARLRPRRSGVQRCVRSRARRPGAQARRRHSPSSVRVQDVVARWGARSSSCCSPRQPRAMVVAEKIRATIENNGFEIPDETFHVTPAIGIAPLTRNDSLDVVTARADEALYHGMRTGKNKVVVRSAEAPDKSSV